MVQGRHDQVAPGGAAQRYASSLQAPGKRLVWFDNLVISVRTVETHVQHIMDKLGCSTRAQIAAWSAARSPVA
jgi:Bacterial regulatory proteins, luxR family